jgi:hypothetical protein
MARSGRSHAWRRRTLTLGVIAALVSPVLRDRDSFPLSTYPMYAGATPRMIGFATAVGYDADGRSQRLSLSVIARTDDALIAQAAVRNAIALGRADAYCREIAGRAGRAIVRIEVVEERHDVIAWADRRPSLAERAVRADCPVAR